MTCRVCLCMESKSRKFSTYGDQKEGNSICLVQEQCYQQKYLLQVLTDEDEVGLDPPELRIELCQEGNMALV